MLNWLIKHKEAVFLGLFCLIFFCIYSYFNLLVINPAGAGDSPKFSSPDETANYFWIRQFAAGEPLYYFEALNGVGTSLIHLRGMNTVDGKITPGSFLGMIFIYGSLAKVFGLGIVPYLTPLFATLGILFFYLLLNKIFHSRPVAVISACLLAFTPAWFYYSSRGMYHNVLFASLLIIGVYFLWKALADSPSYNFKFLILNFSAKLNANNSQFAEGGSASGGKINQKSKIKNQKSDKLPITHYALRITHYLFYILSGLFIGLALITRTSEIVWVSLTVLLILILHFKKIYWPGLVLFIAAGLIPFIMLFYHNQILYGAFISAGYRSIIPEGGASEVVRSGILFKILITPFGINLRSIVINTYNYLFKLLPTWSSLAIIGGFLFAVLPVHLIKISYKKRFIYLAYGLVLTVYLLIFYGSWQFSDRIDLGQLSLGTSYLRYWLPIYIFSLPFIAGLFWHIAKLLIPRSFHSGRLLRVIISAGLILALAIPTFNLVYRQTDESLFLLRNLSESVVKSALINQLTSAGDVVVVYKQADKIFFPERKKIITDLVVPSDYSATKNLVKIRTVYYYTYAPTSTVEFISRRDFEPLGMEITSGQKVFGPDWLYKIQLTGNN